MLTKRRDVDGVAKFIPPTYTSITFNNIRIEKKMKTSKLPETCDFRFDAEQLEPECTVATVGASDDDWFVCTDFWHTF